jgi:hypothetical protein
VFCVDEMMTDMRKELGREEDVINVCSSCGDSGWKGRVGAVGVVCIWN